MSCTTSAEASQLVMGYKELTDIEHCFRLMKSGLELRPIYHRLDERIEAHVLVCVLGLVLTRVAELRCDQSWFQLETLLSPLCAVRMEFSDGQVVRRGQMGPNQRNAFTLCAIQLPSKLVYISN